MNKVDYSAPEKVKNSLPNKFNDCNTLHSFIQKEHPLHKVTRYDKDMFIRKMLRSIENTIIKYKKSNLRFWP